MPDRVCKIEDFKNGWAWCKTHDVGFSPKKWKNKKHCPYSCQCQSCKILNQVLGSIHWSTKKKADKKVLKAVDKIWTSWGINCT